MQDADCGCCALKYVYHMKPFQSKDSVKVSHRSAVDVMEKKIRCERSEVVVDVIM